MPVTKGGWNCANIAGHKGAPLGATVCIPGARIVRLRVNRLDTMLWHNVVTRLWPFPGTHITAVTIFTHKDKIGLWAVLMLGIGYSPSLHYQYNNVRDAFKNVLAEFAR